MRTAEPPVAWRCAVALLDRGYGRPVTSLEAQLHLTASPPATAMSWHDQLLARAMMRLPDRVTDWPPLLPERGHELECFRDDLAHLNPQASDFPTALKQALEETEQLEGPKDQTPLWLRCLGDHMVALYPEDWNGHGLFGVERRQLQPTSGRR
jgi:hypothetical protein